MPLLMCPNDNASMTTVNRDGVEFDMCPSCRGVWLDRGELEKLISAGEAPERQAPPAPGYQRPVQHGEYRSDNPGRYDRDDDGYRKKKRRDFFDIFD